MVLRLSKKVHKSWLYISWDLLLSQILMMVSSFCLRRDWVCCFFYSFSLIDVSSSSFLLTCSFYGTSLILSSIREVFSIFSIIDLRCWFWLSRSLSSVSSRLRLGSSSIFDSLSLELLNSLSLELLRFLFLLYAPNVFWGILCPILGRIVERFSLLVVSVKKGDVHPLRLWLSMLLSFALLLARTLES